MQMHEIEAACSAGKIEKFSAGNGGNGYFLTVHLREVGMKMVKDSAGLNRSFKRVDAIVDALNAFPATRWLALEINLTGSARADL
jgi:hypothetical protein